MSAAHPRNNAATAAITMQEPWSYRSLQTVVPHMPSRFRDAKLRTAGESRPLSERAPLRFGAWASMNPRMGAGRALSLIGACHDVRAIPR